MTSIDCQRVRLNLGSFVDGELPGAEMLPVAQHMANCTDCAGEVERVQDLGQWLRRGAAAAVSSEHIEGLAGSVVSRFCAEEAQSWSAKFSRAREDWHWALVGSGAIAAAFVSIVFVSMLLHFGPAPQREDSLSAILMNMTASPGDMYMRVTEAGSDRGSMVVQVDSGLAGAPTMTMPEGLAGHADEDLLQSFMALITSTNAGKPIDVASQSPKFQRSLDAMVETMRRRRFDDSVMGSGPVAVHQLWLVANTSVSAKAL